MSSIGRLDLVKGLKRYFELTGRAQPSLGEGIVPTVSIADLGRGAFSLDIEWTDTVNLVGAVGTNGFVEIGAAAANPRTIVTLEYLHFGDGLAKVCEIQVNLAASGVGVARTATAVKALDSRRDSVAAVSLVLGDVAVGAGGYRVRMLDGDRSTYRLPIFAVSGTSRILLFSTANDQVLVTYGGRIFATSAA